MYVCVCNVTEWRSAELTVTAQQLHEADAMSTVRRVTTPTQPHTITLHMLANSATH